MTLTTDKENRRSRDLDYHSPCDFHSTQMMFGPFHGPDFYSYDPRELSVALDIGDDILDGFNFLCILVRYLHLVFLFQSHDQFHDVERIGP